MNFIELTEVSGRKVFVNMPRVQYMAWCEDDKDTMLIFDDNTPFPMCVKETPQQILEKVQGGQQ